VSEKLPGFIPKDILPPYIGAATRPNPENPFDNEDVWVAVPSVGVAVLDGMGGMYNATLAAQTAGNTIEKILERMPPGLPNEFLEDHVIKILTDANNAVLNLPQNTENNMGATAAVVLYSADQSNPKRSNRITIGWAGDVRVYITDNWHLKHATIDHRSSIQNLARTTHEKQSDIQERIAQANNPKLQLTSDEYMAFRTSYVITEYIGNPDFQAEVNTVSVRPGQKIIIVSDGVTDNLTVPEIIAGIHGKNNAMAAYNIVSLAQHFAMEYGRERRKSDDATCIITDTLPVEIRRGKIRNPEIAIRETKTMAELFDVLDKIKEIQGSNTVYSANTLKDLIRKLYMDPSRIPLGMITYGAGLRIKVCQILDIPMV